MADPVAVPARGLLDTSVLIDIDVIDGDLLTAVSNGLAPFTRNPNDFVGLEQLISIRKI